MMPPPTVALVILNYNGKKYLERFLPSVLKYAPQHAQIIVGDNASTDDSIDFVATQYPGVRLIVWSPASKVSGQPLIMQPFQ